MIILSLFCPTKGLEKKAKTRILKKLKKYIPMLLKVEVYMIKSKILEK